MPSSRSRAWRVPAGLYLAPGQAWIPRPDLSEIRAILDVPRFYNKCEPLLLKGDHDRATALVQLVRDKEFYGDKGGACAGKRGVTVTRPCRGEVRPGSSGEIDPGGAALFPPARKLTRRSAA